MLHWLNEHASTIVTIVSLILNALGGTGVVRPLVDVRKAPGDRT